MSEILGLGIAFEAPRSIHVNYIIYKLFSKFMEDCHNPSSVRMPPPKEIVGRLNTSVKIQCTILAIPKANPLGLETKLDRTSDL